MNDNKPLSNIVYTVMIISVNLLQLSVKKMEVKKASTCHFWSHFTEELVEAVDAVRVIVLGNISLPGQGSIAIPAAEVVDVPSTAFSLRVLSGKYYLPK